MRGIMPSVGQSETALLEISERIVMPRYVFLYFLVAFALFFCFFLIKIRLRCTYPTRNRITVSMLMDRGLSFDGCEQKEQGKVY